MRFQVPQNLDVKDNIFLGLSFSQLIYITGAGGFLIFLFLIVGNLLVVVLFGGPVLLFALFLAFFKYNTLNSTQVLQAIISYLVSSKMYLWDKSKNEQYTERRVVSKNAGQQQTMPTVKRGSGERVASLNKDLFFDTQAPTNEPEVTI